MGSSTTRIGTYWAATLYHRTARLSLLRSIRTRPIHLISTYRTGPASATARKTRPLPDQQRRNFTPAPPSQTPFRAIVRRSMASDEDYMAFLDKANQDPSAGRANTTDNKTGASKGFKAQDAGLDIPKPIASALKKDDSIYVSEADEPFVGVALEWDEGGKGLPDEVEFARLIDHPDPENADVQLMDPMDWDTEGNYQSMLEAVREAGKGNDVRVYRVPGSGARVEYWLVTTDGKGKGAKLVGVKALAVES